MKGRAVGNSKRQSHPAADRSQRRAARTASGSLVNTMEKAGNNGTLCLGAVQTQRAGFIIFGCMRSIEYGARYCLKQAAASKQAGAVKVDGITLLQLMTAASLQVGLLVLSTPHDARTNVWPKRTPDDRMG